ncbi:MAG: exo-alpha-sialidase, partial [Planctomycetales bacterium]
MPNDPTFPSASRRTFLGALTGTGALLLYPAGAEPAPFADPPPAAAEGMSGVIGVEFLFAQAPFPSCHASTIVETGKGLTAAWFGGTDEGANDVGIWVSHRESAAWSKPVEVANGIDTDGKRYPCWNPVLCVVGHELVLFYKVGPSPSRWWGLLKRSTDDGQTWSASEQLPLGIFGPIRNKPLLLADGTLLCGSSTEHKGWQVQMERGQPGLTRWEATAPLNDAAQWGLIQPTILQHAGGALQILCRSRQKRIVEAWSRDGGLTWTPPESISLPNPNSGIDGV